MNNKNTLLCIGSLIVGTTICKAAQVSGQILLQDEANHSGTQVVLKSIITTPALGFAGISILLCLIGAWLILSRKSATYGAVCLILATLVYLPCLAAKSQYSTTTDSSGVFTFIAVSPGTYSMTASHPDSCHEDYVLNEFAVSEPATNLNPVTLPSAISSNELSIASILKQIKAAQWQYNTESSPHTYTDLDHLISGEGGSGIPYITDDLVDGIVSGYHVQAALPDFVDPNGSYWSWSATAFPLEYQCTGIRSFYADESNDFCITRGADIGGLPGDSTLPLICDELAERLAHRSMLNIAAAEMDYNNNSSPHTFTDLIHLATGEGAGNVSFIVPELGDSEMCGYQYLLQLPDVPDPSGSYWSWSCTAWPIVYDDDSRFSFYIDETAIQRCEDIGGVPGSLNMPMCTITPTPCIP